MDALRSGAIVAVKGLGGYHLACRADLEPAVAALRARKRREDRPFALMAPSLEAARELVELSPADELLIQGRERPIVIARRRPGAAVAESVAPASADLGVMLPYSPLHHLLLADLGATLVMTSANVSDEPIAYEDGEARERLDGIADLFLTHDRPIHMRTDDSVVRSTARGPLLMRRSRGLRAGEHRAAGRGAAAAGLRRRAQEHLLRGQGRHRLGGAPHRRPAQLGDAELVPRRDRALRAPVRGRRPRWWPTTCTRTTSPPATRCEREGVRHEAVQHHHAHLAACLAEHGETGPAVGAIYDGSGYGGDGTVWGGELLVGGLTGFERAGMLLPVRLPGGDRAATRAVADGVRVAGGGRGRRAAAAGGRRRWIPAAGGAWPTWCAAAWRRR